MIHPAMSKQILWGEGSNFFFDGWVVGSLKKIAGHIFFSGEIKQKREGVKKIKLNLIKSYLI